MQLDIECNYSLSFANRAKRTAGHLPVSDVICIVTCISPMKTKDVAAENKRTRKPFQLSNLRLFLCIRSSNAGKFTVLGCYDHNLNSDRKQRHHFGKCTDVLKKGIFIRFVYSEWHFKMEISIYDVGPLCPIVLCQ